MTTNTQGPWHTDATAGFPLDIHDQDNVLVARVQPCPAAHNVARRIVACVNACEGVPEGLLHAGAYREMMQAQTELVTQRDALLAALEKALVALEQYEVEVDSEWGSCRSLAEIEADGDLDQSTIDARTAIAAAKGGAA